MPGLLKDPLTYFIDKLLEFTKQEVCEDLSFSQEIDFNFIKNITNCSLIHRDPDQRDYYLVTVDMSNHEETDYLSFMECIRRFYIERDEIFDYQFSWIHQKIYLHLYY